MKVSITFDKNLAESTKNKWVKEMQAVVTKLNNKNNLESAPQSPPKPGSRYPSPIHYPPSGYRQKESNLCQQLAIMRKSMDEKFQCLIGVVRQLTDKVDSVEQRVRLLEIKQQQKLHDNQQFDKGFQRVLCRYDQVREREREREGQPEKSNIKIVKMGMRETSASGFSYDQDLDQSSC